MPTLVLMAAGLGTRFGGLKQVAGVGPSGEALMDYTVHDGVVAGFGRLVLIVRSEIRDVLAGHAERYRGSIDVELCLQDADRSAPRRDKPWGTCHAVLAAADLLGEPFAVLNADDFYGRRTMRLLARSHDTNCLVAYRLADTLSSHGAVMRGVCSVRDGRLLGITETSIPVEPSGAGFTGDEPVSMNAWGFVPSILHRMRASFASFLDANGADPGAELQLPTVVHGLLQTQDPPPFVLHTSNDRWVGITHADDVPSVRESLARMHADGVYPPALFA